MVKARTHLVFIVRQGIIRVSASAYIKNRCIFQFETV